MQAEVTAKRLLLPLQDIEMREVILVLITVHSGKICRKFSCLKLSALSSENHLTLSN